ncbi:MAG TPA: cysteine--1-D-myo-inosityl 2-amino-2-deoxy-alpha-D-glucopyranoside ligase [Propionibacteriaceae bacterium]|nr:cysteine--1-D-myo-inosityl 2-amino-2-deoxy-alpha-D-glucopyranoside ligase [Propionibacteriaceae bacterium]
MKSWPSPSLPSPVSGTTATVTAYDTVREAVAPVGPESGTARLYVCGITPYDATHMGHAFTYVTFDLLNRAWRDAGLAVAYTQNVTDIDDPLLERASATGVDWVDLANEQTDLFREDMTSLRVLPPDTYVGAVEAIPEVDALVARLSEAGYIYQVDDEYPDWYFTTTRAAGFGEVSSYSHEQMLEVFAERGGDPDRAGKRDPLDCLVWRLERDGEPAWDSSLGRGRPGWHIECTAIALDTLGTSFDVQGGGSDLVFPHHEMCAAEAVAATGEPFAKAYVHVAMVGLDGEKMSKSKGNLVLVSQLREQGVDPMAIRLVLLGHHHLTEWSWTSEDLEANVARLGAWRAAVSGATSVAAEETVRAVRAAVADDLHADRALAVLDAWASASLKAETDVPGARDAIRDLVDGLLGVAL